MFKVTENGIESGKLLAKNSMLNLLGAIAPLFVGIIAIPFAIKGLGKDGFGVLAIAWVVLGYFGLFDFGLSSATIKFVSESLGKKDIESIPSIVWTSVVVSCLLGFLGTIILVFITPYLVGTLLKIPDVLIQQSKTSFYMLAFALPIVICSTSLRGVLGGAQRFDLLNLVVIPTSMLSFIIPGLAFPFNLSLPKVLFLIIISRLAAAISYLFLSFKVFPVIKKQKTLSLKFFNRMISYGGWVTVTNIISPLLVYLDRFVIGALISMASVTFYSAPYEMITRLRIFSNAIATTIFPEFSTSSIKPINVRIEIIFSRVIKYILIVLSTAVIILCTYTHLILQVWLGNEYVNNSTNVFRILSVGVLLNSLALVPLVLLQGIGRPDIPAKFHLLEFPIYILLLIYLVINFGIDGAALAWAIRVAFDGILLYGMAKRIYPNIFYQLKNEKIFMVILFLLLFYAALFCSNLITEDVISKALSFILILLLFGIAIWRYIFDDVEKILLQSLILKTRKN